MKIIEVPIESLGDQSLESIASRMRVVDGVPVEGFVPRLVIPVEAIVEVDASVGHLHQGRASRARHESNTS